MCVQSLATIKQALESFSTELEIVVHQLNELIECCRRIAHEWECYIERLESNGHHNFEVSAEYTGQRGRPCFGVKREQLIYLASLGFSWTSIASLLGVSRMTVYRRRVEYDLLADPVNTLNDNELKDLLRRIRREYPNIGQTMIMGLIRAQGYHVSRARVRDATQQIDPLGTALHWHMITCRRQYRVPSPNSLWHIGL